MRRHSIIGRLGLKDTEAIKVAEPSSHQTELQLVTTNQGLTYGVQDTIEEVRRIGGQPTENGLDLLLLAIGVYCADTRIARKSEAQDSWSREIDIYLPVSEPDRWMGLRARLAHALEFLSGDKWRFFFRPRPRGFEQLGGEPLPRERKSLQSVCLFSGGLDSFIGAIDLFEKGESPVLVSHGWVGSASSRQKLCESALQGKYGKDRVRRVNSRIGFGQGIVLGTTSESTERSRSFLFFSLASLTASAFTGEGKIIYVPENGLITLNVPLDPLRLGSLSTRTTHPYFIARFNELLAGLGLSAVLQNPYRHKTKGAMVRECRNEEFLGANITSTMSCSSMDKARWLKRTPGHCGYCLPCLIRKASLAQWPGGDPTPYVAADTPKKVLNSLKAEGDNVRSLQLAIHRLGGSLARATVLIHKSGPLRDAPDEIPKFAQVYLDGMHEVAQVVGSLQTHPDA